MGDRKSFLGNKYWVLRHGRSIPNVLELIVSSMENGILEEYGLAPRGVEQALSAGDSFREELKRNSIELERVRICYSPFSRTRQTAQHVASRLGIPFFEEGPPAPQCMVINDLRERFFGRTFELQSHDKYQEIWALDEEDPFMRPDLHGESVADVVSRLTNAITTIESSFQGCAVLIVSHGDPLQILQTVLGAALQGENTVTDDCNQNLASRIAAVTVSSVLSQHRKFFLGTGELRPLP
ncbi:unnamed protein product [Cuscuta epithymum]|uniref:Uncharacterized protein n=1 Tax=Cuscuta epithymum TaxID=186058 RepID=A0AAV0DT92_9ASTE|nr:unnamed protein product [Cuscuta epithymum]CAH9125998.1 unnamed protein product [Cuscuta epithymum]